MAAIKVPIVSEFNKAGITDAERALQKFGVTAPKELKKAAAGFAILGGAGLAAFKQLDSGFDAIVVGTGATGAALDGLKDDAKAVAREVPNSFAEVGQAIADVNTRLGLTGEPLQDMTKRFLDLSRITKTDVSTNIAAVTRLFGDWSVSTEDQAGKLDLLFAASQQTGIGVDRLSQLVVQFGAPLRQLGFSLEESVAMFGKFEKEGVNIETVMAGLRMGLGKMAKAGEEPIETFKRLVAEIKEAGTQGEANAIALQAFGQRAGPDMAAAIREGRFELDGLLTALESSGGALDTAVEGTTDFNDSLAKVRNQLMIAAAPAVEKFAKVLDLTVGALTKLPEPIQTVIVGLGALALASKSARSAMLAFGGTSGATGVAGMVGNLKSLASVLAVAAVGYESFRVASAGAAGDTDILYRNIRQGIPVLDEVAVAYQELGRRTFELFGGQRDAMDAWTGHEKAAASAFAEMTEGIYTQEQLTRRLNDSTLSLEARNLVTIEFGKQLDKQAEAEANLTEAVEEGTEATDESAEVARTATGDSMRLKEMYGEAAWQARGLAGESADLTEETDELTEAQKQLAANLEETATETERAKNQQDIFESQLEDSRQAVEDLNQSVQDMRDAQRAAADATFALHSAEKDLYDQVNSTNEMLTDGTADLYTIRAAFEETATSAAAVADAQVRIATETAAASGQVLSAKEAQDIWNASMVISANQLDGPMKKSVLDYIGAVNGVPGGKITEVAAQFDDMTMPEIEAEAEAAGLTVGEYMAQGMAQGIRAAKAEVEAAAREIAGAATDAANVKLGVSSPSKVWAEIGGYMIEGLAQGIIAGTPEAAIEAALAAEEITEEAAKELRDNLRAEEEARRLSERIGEAIVDELDAQQEAVMDAAEALVVAAEERLSAAGDRLSGVFSGVGDRNSLADARERVSDDERSIAEAEAALKAAQADPESTAKDIADLQERLSDDKTSLERSNLALFKQLVESGVSPIGAGAEQTALRGIGTAAGLSMDEMNQLAQAMVASRNAQSQLTNAQGQAAAAAGAFPTAEAIGAAVAAAITKEAGEGNTYVPDFETIVQAIGVILAEIAARDRGAA